MAFIDFQGRSSDDQGLPVETIVFAGIFVLFVYSTVQFLRPFVALHGHLRRARAIGLPMKVIPFPPGLFSFFAFQVLRRLGLLRPGTNLHKLLSMGRPDGYDLHKEMGDVFVTVSPAGLTLIVADPKVATHVNSKRTEFPKPPNTGGEPISNRNLSDWKCIFGLVQCPIGGPDKLQFDRFSHPAHCTRNIDVEYFSLIFCSYHQHLRTQCHQRRR